MFFGRILFGDIFGRYDIYLFVCCDGDRKGFKYIVFRCIIFG